MKFRVSKKKKKKNVEISNDCIIISFIFEENLKFKVRNNKYFVFMPKCCKSNLIRSYF